MNHDNGFSVGEYVSKGKVLGRGTSSKVYLGRHKLQAYQVAIKVVAMDRRTDQRLRDYLTSEIIIMQRVSHPNVIRMHTHYTSETHVYIVLEYCGGGNLADYMSAHRQGLPETLVQELMRQMSSGLLQLRMAGVVHRDLKPQNLLLHRAEDNSLRLCIADFGLACHGRKNEEMMYSVVGSPRYMAPELLQAYTCTLPQGYSDKTELWSVGAIMYEMLYGSPPYHHAQTPDELLRFIGEHHTVPLPQTHNLSDLCLSLLRALLVQDVNERMDWEKFFSHEWIQPLPSSQPISPPPPPPPVETHYEPKPLMEDRAIAAADEDDNSIVLLCVNSDDEDASMELLDRSAVSIATLFSHGYKYATTGNEAVAKKMYQFALLCTRQWFTRMGNYIQKYEYAPSHMLYLRKTLEEYYLFYDHASKALGDQHTLSATIDIYQYIHQHAMSFITSANRVDIHSNVKLIWRNTALGIFELLCDHADTYMDASYARAQVHTLKNTLHQ